MGTPRSDLIAFEDFLGQDITRSNLSRNPKAAISMKNIERLENGSMRGREGIKLAAQPMFIRGLHRYTYLDEDETPQEELLAVAYLNPGQVSSLDKNMGMLVRLKKAELTIDYSGSDDWRPEILFDCTSNTLKFKLYENGSLVLTTDLGTGYGATPVTLKTLADAITAITNFSCFPYMTAVVNGAVTGALTFNVDAGHTVEVGEQLLTEMTKSFPPSGTWQMYTEVLVAGATSLQVRGDAAGLEVKAADNEVIGHGRYPAAILDLYNAAATDSTSIGLQYYYWEPIRARIDGEREPFQISVSKFAGEQLRAPTFVNYKNSCFFSGSLASQAGTYKIVGEGDTATVSELFVHGLWKYDSKNLYIAGPISTLTTTRADVMSLAASSSSGSIPAGRYKYQLSVVKKDAWDNEFETFFEYIDSITLGASKNVEISVGSSVAGGANALMRATAFDLRSNTVNGDEATKTSTITLDANQTFRTGDYLYVRAYGSDDIQRTRVTAWTNTTVTVSPTVTANDNDVIANYCMRVWRTKDLGSEFFLSCEKTPALTGTPSVLVDSTTDANLGININSVKQESIQYPFPNVYSLAVHQDRIVAAGLGLNEAIAWEDPLYPECIDAARSIADVPGGTLGTINAIRSNTSSSLLILKDTSVFQATGSFASNEVEISRIIENSYGASADSALDVVEKMVFAVGRAGGVAMDENNNTSYTIASYILELFRNRKADTTQNISLRKIQVAYDENKRWIHIFLPFESSAPVAENLALGSIGYYPNSASRYFVIQLPQLDEQGACVSEYTYGLHQLPNGGMANFDNRFFTASYTYDEDLVGTFSNGWPGYLHYRLENAVSDKAEDYTDNGAPYNWEMIPQWYDGGSPQKDKPWYEFVLYQLQPDSWVSAFTALFESYRDWDLTKIDTQRTTSLTFSSSTDTEKTLEFDNNHTAKRRTFKLSGTVCKNPPLFTGYGYTVDEDVIEQDSYSRKQ